MSEHEGTMIRFTRRVRLLDAWTALSSAGALVVIGPLRGAVESFHPFLFVSTIVLFMMPGVLLAQCFLQDDFPGAALVPVAFVISASIFGLLGVPLLLLGRDLELYLLLSGAIVATSLVAAALIVVRRRPPTKRKREATTGFYRWLWAPFLLLSTTLAFVSQMKVPQIYDDTWVYLANIREFLNTNKLGFYEPYFGHETGLSRVKINGWLLEQATLSWVSGIDPIALVLKYLAPTLVVVALLAFYTLAQTLFKDQAAALLASVPYALFLLMFGGGIVARIAEDKFATRYIFLPIALSLAVAFLESRKLRSLGLFTLVCWAVMAVHPVGLAIIGLSMGGFGLFYLAVNWREREAWAKMVSLGVVLLSALVVPAIAVFLVMGEPLTTVLKDADINSNDPDVLANMVFVRPDRQRILQLGGDFYILHPSLLLNPVILAGYLLGFPFLLWRLKRRLAAQLLLGVLYLVTVVCYVPQLATFVGDRIVLPGQLWRLAWPIPLAALLTIGWMSWDATRLAGAGLNRLGLSSRVTRLLPLLLIGAMITAAAPASIAKIKEVYSSSGVPQSSAFPFDPVFRWMQANIKEPSVVLARDGENTFIPAYSAQANVVSLRGIQVLDHLAALERRAPGKIQVPQGARDVRTFFSSSSFDEQKIDILQRYGVDYVLVPTDHPLLNENLKRTPGFTILNTPGQRYKLYAVNLQELGKQSTGP